MSHTDKLLWCDLLHLLSFFAPIMECINTFDTFEYLLINSKGTFADWAMVSSTNIERARRAGRGLCFTFSFFFNAFLMEEVVAGVYFTLNHFLPNIALFLANLAFLNSCQTVLTLDKIRSIWLTLMSSFHPHSLNAFLMIEFFAKGNAFDTCPRFFTYPTNFWIWDYNLLSLAWIMSSK